jgi:hypothetical protein
MGVYNMFILFEKSNVRYVYLLKERVRLESTKKDGQIFVSSYYMDDREIFSNQEIGIPTVGGVKLVGYDDAYAVYKTNLWLNWIEYGEILKTIDDEKKLQYNKIV